MKNIIILIILCSFCSVNIFSQCNPEDKELIHNAGFEYGDPAFPTDVRQFQPYIEVWEDDQSCTGGYHSPDWFKNAYPEMNPLRETVYPSGATIYVEGHSGNCFAGMGAAETISDKVKKYCFQFEIGGHYRVYFGAKHIYYKPIDSSNRVQAWYNTNSGFDKHNNIAFDVLFSFRYHFYPFLFFETGIGLVNRLEKLSSPDDTVKYYNSLNPFYHSLVNLRTNNIYCFYVPFYIGYRYKFFSVKTGLDVDFFRIYHFKTKNLNNEKKNYTYCGYKYYWEEYKRILYPVINIEFDIYKIANKATFKISLGARMNDIKSYDFIIKPIIRF